VKAALVVPDLVEARILAPSVESVGDAWQFIQAEVASRLGSTQVLDTVLEMLSKNPEFESLARQFLAAHPHVRHEWRQIRGLFGWGIARTDLLCAPGGGREVFASLRGGQITVGSKSDDTDFESWARETSQAEVEREAFAFFVHLLEREAIIASPEHGADYP
jgi:hypothetical protein